jgi:hypothetical protein
VLFDADLSKPEGRPRHEPDDHNDHGDQPHHLDQFDVGHPDGVHADHDVDHHDDVHADHDVDHHDANHDQHDAKHDHPDHLNPDDLNPDDLDDDDFDHDLDHDHDIDHDAQPRYRPDDPHRRVTDDQLLADRDRVVP